MFENETRKEVVALDVGTNTVCVAIMKGEKKTQGDAQLGLYGKTRVLGVGYQLAKGLKFGTLCNLEDLEDSILAAVASAEKEAEKGIRSVYVAIPTWSLQSHVVKTSINIGQIPVDEIHLSALLKFDTSECIDDEREIIHAFPVSYSIDGISEIQDPRGMIGDKLSAVFHVVTAPSAFLKNIKGCLNRNNIDVSGFISSTYASALAVTLREEVSSGVTIVDIGGSITSIACLYNETLLYLGYIPIGSQSITNDIATVLRITRPSAERIKILYGVSAGTTGDETILVSRIDEYGEEHAQNISKQLLNEIISDRLEEILERVREHIYNCGADKALYQTIIFTGGGSQLSGLNEFIRLKKYFSDVSVRLGKPINTTGSHDFVKSSSFASTAGTALYCMGAITSSYSNSSKKSFWNKIMVWFKRGI